jgi:hypothetical protein
MRSFQIEITKQGWIATQRDDYDPVIHDLCTHGDVRLIIGGGVVAAGDGGEYGISEAALGLLRTIHSDRSSPVAESFPDRLIPHGCGTILMMGCPIGIDWSVTHDGDFVSISDVVRYDSTDDADAVQYRGLEVQIANDDYRAEVVAFARCAKEPFEGIEKSFFDDEDRIDYVRFWGEYDRLLRLAG